MSCPRSPFGLRIVILIVTLAAVLPGCARRASVSGVVTYEGKPVSNGSVVFFAVDTGEPDSLTGRSAIDSKGHYAISGMMPGKKRIEVAAGRQWHFPSEAAERLPPPKLDFPDNAEGNGQIVELQAGANQVDIALKKPVGNKANSGAKTEPAKSPTKAPDKK